MAGFNSAYGYKDFSNEAKRSLRFVRTPEAEVFLRAVSDSMERRRRTLRAGMSLCRAQLGCRTVRRPTPEDRVEEEEVPFEAARMVPLPDRAREGRANPQGIPCLYLSTDRETALAEVRPWPGSLVSLGIFKTVRELHVVDCSRYHEGAGLLPSEPDELETAAWTDIDQEFSRPVTRSDDVADYVPTQILAELFKSKEMDGLLYKSALRDGGNSALFDLEAAKIQCCQLFKIETIRFAFAKYGNPWRTKEE